MPSPTFIGVDADGIEPDDDLGTALLQRVDENAQWCRINRAPQPALCFESAVESEGAIYAMRLPMVGTAQWTLLGPFPVWIPQGAELRGADPSAPCQIDLLMLCDVAGDNSVSVCAVSAEALPTGFGATWCQANCQVVYIGGDVVVRFTGLTVRPGMVNRVYIGVRSSITWQGVDDDLQIVDANGFGRLTGKQHSLDHASALFEQQVPYVAIAPGHSGSPDDNDAEYARTVGLCFYDADTNKWPSALIADMLRPQSFWPADQVSQWGEAKDSGGVFFGTLDTLAVKSVAPDVTNAGDWPDRVNNGGLRAFQAAGSCVEQLGWNVNALDQYRQAMAFTVWPRQFPIPDDPAWPGLWRATPLDTYPGGGSGVTYTAPLIIGPQRDADLSLTLQVGVMAQVIRSVGTVTDGTAFAVNVKVRTSAAVPDTIIDVDSTISPPIVVAAPYPLGGFGWTTSWVQIVSSVSKRPATNEVAFVSGQPWSHDGCVDPRDAQVLFAPCEVRVDVSRLTVGTQYHVEISVQNLLGPSNNAVLCLGAAYGRLVVGA